VNKLEDLFSLLCVSINMSLVDLAFTMDLESSLTSHLGPITHFSDRRLTSVDHKLFA
jgi:hypothetical protein